MSIFTSRYALTETKTHTSAQIITFFAFFIFSSSPDERRYNIPPYISASTAKTATYCITVAIRFHITSNVTVLLDVLHQGSHSQFGLGAAKASR